MYWCYAYNCTSNCNMVCTSNVYGSELLTLHLRRCECEQQQECNCSAYKAMKQKFILLHLLKEFPDQNPIDS